MGKKCSLSGDMPTEVLIGIVVGSFCTILGVYIEHYLDEKREKKRLLEALLDEIDLNIGTAEKTLNEINSGGAMTGLPYRPLYTLSYQNIRQSGYLVDSFSKDKRIKLAEAFDKIYEYDRDKRYKGWHQKSLKMLLKELRDVKTEIIKRRVSCPISLRISQQDCSSKRLVTRFNKR